MHARLARFVCVIALARPGHPPELVEGTLPGVIEFEPHGSGGFGYDPLFYVLDENCTLAELPLNARTASATGPSPRAPRGTSSSAG